MRFVCPSAQVSFRSCIGPMQGKTAILASSETTTSR